MKIDSADRKILLVAAAVFLVAIVGAAAILPSQDEELSYPSPYSTAASGAKAAYSLLPQLGYTVEHWRSAPGKLLDRGANTVLVIGLATQNPTPENAAAVRHYIESGGRVLAIGQAAAALLPREAVFPGMPHFAWQQYRALLPSGITNRAEAISMAPSVYWKGDDSATEIDFGDSQNGVVASYKYGKGSIVWWSSPDPLTNSGITQSANLQLLLNSLGSPQERAVLWDDYFHEGEATFVDSMLASPLKWSLLQFGLLALAVVLTFSRRHGPLRSLPQTSPMATLEFVDTLGALYQRAEATELPVQVAYERFRHLLHRKLGISTSATPQQVVARLEVRLGNLAPACERLLSQCESSPYQSDIPQQESLRLVKSLELFSAKLRITSRTNEGAK
jgi:uncharacterized protein DUF4350